MQLIDSLLSRHAIRKAGLSVLLVVLLAPATLAADVAVRACGCTRDLAFAKYIASQEQGDPFSNAGQVGVLIQASLPGLYKSAGMVGIHAPGENNRHALEVVQVTGDGTVAEEVITSFFALLRELDGKPPRSVAITPENYRFHFAGEVKTGNASAYVYRVTPRKQRPGLVDGEIWMDSESGREVMLSGRLLSATEAGRDVAIVRDTKMINGIAYERTTHLAFALPRLGRAELFVTELPLTEDMAPQQQ